MNLYPSIDFPPRNNLTKSLQDNTRISLRPLFYGDNLDVVIYPKDNEGNFPSQFDGATFTIAIGDLTPTKEIYLEQTVVHTGGASITTRFDLSLLEFKGATRDIIETDIQLEIQVVYSSVIETIVQATGTLRNQLLDRELVDLVAPVAPSNITSVTATAPNPPEIPIAIATPAEPSNIDVQNFAQRTPLAPSFVSSELWFHPDSPTPPSDISVIIRATSDAPTAIERTTMEPWLWQSLQTRVPQAYKFEATGIFNKLNGKVFAWDGVSLENGAPVYKCSSGSCQVSSTGGIERIRANRIYSTSINWQLYYNSEGGYFDGSNTNLGLTSSNFPLGHENLSYHEAGYGSSTVKFIPTSLPMPASVSNLTASVAPAEPSVIDAKVQFYNYDTDFDHTDPTWDGWYRKIILLASTSLTNGGEFNAGKILDTVGKGGTNNALIRVEDPDNPRDKPFTIGNQNTGYWTWFEFADRGTKWEFVILGDYQADAYKRKVEQATLKVDKGASSLLSGYYQQTGYKGHFDTNSYWKNDGFGTAGAEAYLMEKTIDLDCTETTASNKRWLVKRLYRGSDYISVYIDWYSTFPLWGGSSISSELGEFNDDDYSAEDWATLVTGATSCPVKPNQPNYITSTFAPIPTSIDLVNNNIGEPNPRGIAWDGSYFRIVGTKFYSIYKHDGEYLSSAQYHSATVIYESAGICWNPDKQVFAIVHNKGSGHLFEMDSQGRTKSQVSSYIAVDLTPYPTKATGVTWDGSHYWISGYSLQASTGGTISLGIVAKYNSAGTRLTNFYTATGSHPSDIIWYDHPNENLADNSKGSLWLLDRQNKKIERWSAYSATKQSEGRTGLTENLYGITHDGTNFWLLKDDNNDSTAFTIELGAQDAPYFSISHPTYGYPSKRYLDTWVENTTDEIDYLDMIRILEDFTESTHQFVAGEYYIVNPDQDTQIGLYPSGKIVLTNLRGTKFQKVEPSS